MDQKPLFIPLRTEYFEAFTRGEKTVELRVYGPRWNEKTCAPNRAVVLSKGYGKQNRLRGRIRDFRVQPARFLSSAHQTAILDVFGTLEVDIACIGITDIKPGEE